LGMGLTTIHRNIMGVGHGANNNSP